MNTKEEALRIGDFLTGKPGNFIDALILSTVRFKGWGQDFDSEDVTQNIRLALLQNFREGKYRSSDLAAYVRQVAEIQCIVEMRRRYRSKKYHEDLTLKAAEKPDPEAGPLERMVDEEKRKELFRILKELDRACLKLILFKFHKGLSYKEIGGRFSMTEVNARVSVFRCLKRSREILNKTKGNV